MGWVLAVWPGWRFGAVVSAYQPRVVGAAEISARDAPREALRSCNTALVTGGKGRNTMSNNIDDRWLSRQELADRIGLPVKTLAQWASKGTGPRYARMGRHVRYRVSDIVEWEAAQMEERCEALVLGLTRRHRTEAAPAPWPDPETGDPRGGTQ